MNFLASAMSLSMETVGSGVVDADSIILSRAGASASAMGPAAYFTGRVRIDGPFQADAPAKVGGATVTFEPGARTAWHTHPLGQTLIVIAGVGLVQEVQRPAREIRPGDIVWIPPGVKHWHGARPDTAMTHLAIAEAKDGSPVTWLEHVSDAEYSGR